MSADRLESQLRRFLEHGPEESFVASCAEKFRRIDFPEDTLPIARLYLFYLTASIEHLLNVVSIESEMENNLAIETHDVPSVRAKLDSLGLEGNPGNIALVVGMICCRWAVQQKQDEKEFLTLFIDLWFAYWSESSFQQPITV